MQRKIGLYGMIGLGVYVFMAMGFPSRLIHDWSVQRYIDGVTLDVRMVLDILMAALSVLWICCLSKGKYKYKSFLVGIYLAPLIIDICLVELAVVLGTIHHWKHPVAAK